MMIKMIQSTINRERDNFIERKKFKGNRKEICSGNQENEKIHSDNDEVVVVVVVIIIVVRGP